MKRFALYLVFFTINAVFFVTRSESLDWPQWQGPDRNAVSKETGLLKEWPKEGPALAWRIEKLGGGDSAPSIASGRIYGMSNRGNEEVVWALSEKDGGEIWVSPLGPAVSQRMPQSKEGPGCTPTVDGDRLYVLGIGGALACLQVQDGKIVWQKSLADDFGGKIPTWSYRESPLIDGEKLICTPGGDDATIVALNKSNGEMIWKCKIPDAPSNAESTENNERPRPGGRRGGPGGFGGFGGSGAAYASIIAIDFEGERQYVQLTSKTLVGIAASDGKFLWRYDQPANRMGINCSTPIYNDGMVFAASAYGAGGGLAKLSKDANGGIKAEEVYQTRNMQNHHGGMIVFDGCLYGANGGNEGGYLICLDFKTGTILWNQRDNRGVPKGSILLADGMFYYRTEDGTLLLFEPNREKFIERGRFEQPGRTGLPAWAHPVIANGKLYIRDQDTLFCYDVRAQDK